MRRADRKLHKIGQPVNQRKVLADRVDHNGAERPEGLLEKYIVTTVSEEDDHLLPKGLDFLGQSIEVPQEVDHRGVWISSSSSDLEQVRPAQRLKTLICQLGVMPALLVIQMRRPRTIQLSAGSIV